MFHCGKTVAKSFVMRYSGLKSFVIPYVQGHRLVSTCIFNKQGGRGRGYRSVNKSDPFRKSRNADPSLVASRVWAEAQTYRRARDDKHRYAACEDNKMQIPRRCAARDDKA